MKFREITACSKLQVPKIMYGYQISKKRLNFKNYGDQLHIPNPWHIQNPEILKRWTVFRSLSDISQNLWKKVPGNNYFCRTFLLRPFLDVWQDSKCAYVSINSSYLVQLF